MTSSEARRIWCYAKADVQGLTKALAKLDWQTIVADSPNLDIAWEAWKNTFLSIVSEYIPSKKVEEAQAKAAIDVANIVGGDQEETSVVQEIKANQRSQ